MEKQAFTWVETTQKLRPYFQAHTIVVQTDKPLQRVMNNPDSAGRLVLWAIELGKFDIPYRPRTAIKA